MGVPITVKRMLPGVGLTGSPAKFPAGALIVRPPTPRELLELNDKKG